MIYEYECLSLLAHSWHSASWERHHACSQANYSFNVTSGRSVPSSSSKLSSTHQVATLKPGSVCVDLASPAGGNIVGTVKDEKVVTENGVTIIGYSDLNSRLASTSSSLYANNQMKWILSAGPTTTKTKGEFAIDYEDIAVRGMMMDQGELIGRGRHPPAPAATQACRQGGSVHGGRLQADDRCRRSVCATPPLVLLVSACSLPTRHSRR